VSGSRGEKGMKRGERNDTREKSERRKINVRGTSRRGMRGKRVYSDLLSAI
jgi:hypothetical protein